MQPPPSYSCLLPQVFFSIFPFHLNLSAASPPPHLAHLALTQVISHQCQLNTTTTAPTPWPLQPPPCHLLQACHPSIAPALTCIVGIHKPPHHHHHHCSLHTYKIKAPDKSFPFLPSFIFNGAGHPPPLTQACCTPPWHTSTHPTSPHAHAGHPFTVATTTTTSMPL